MKKLLLSLSILLLPGLAAAQETYSVVINSPAVVAKIDLGRVQYNTGICVSLGLAVSCNQAQACQASFDRTGQPASAASCTAGEALQAGVRIYPNSQNGREGFISNELVKASVAQFGRIQAKLDFAALQGQCKSANQAQVDAICVATGLQAGCGICDNWK